jgi:hypothetical protein
MPAALQYLRKHTEQQGSRGTVKRPPMLKTLRILKVFHGETPPLYTVKHPPFLLFLYGETPPLLSR